MEFPGQIIGNIDNAKNREYEFDALGRLYKAKGGIAAGSGGGSANWTQTYIYDRYANRTNGAASGTAADNSEIPLDGLPNLSFDNTSNRITTTGFGFRAMRAFSPNKFASSTVISVDRRAENRPD